MQAHDEERDIYGVVYVQGKKYFLLEPCPSKVGLAENRYLLSVNGEEYFLLEKKSKNYHWSDGWMIPGTFKWLVALNDMYMERNPDIELGDKGECYRDWETNTEIGRAHV